ncbi:Protein of unknown function [Pyronema omphalodes CBS 100304]|uniref:Uncharacterized protein n=1 Tax=Pyronema omphalodes (strain CBS 100304) TaxID=1076935 RepID=U4L068_PYROM|nr:Protein of unknown function [Pyronema omphalodes CBS 100304]
MPNAQIADNVAKLLALLISSTEAMNPDDADSLEKEATNFDQLYCIRCDDDISDLSHYWTAVHLMFLELYRQQAEACRQRAKEFRKESQKRNETKASHICQSSEKMGANIHEKHGYADAARALFSELLRILRRLKETGCHLKSELGRVLCDEGFGDEFRGAFKKMMEPYLGNQTLSSVINFAKNLYTIAMDPDTTANRQSESDTNAGHEDSIYLQLVRQLVTKVENMLPYLQEQAQAMYPDTISNYSDQLYLTLPALQAGLDSIAKSFHYDTPTADKAISSEPGSFTAGSDKISSNSDLLSLHLPLAALQVGLDAISKCLHYDTPTANHQLDSGSFIADPQSKPDSKECPSNLIHPQLLLQLVDKAKTTVGYLHEQARNCLENIPSSSDDPKTGPCTIAVSSGSDSPISDPHFDSNVEARSSATLPAMPDTISLVFNSSLFRPVRQPRATTEDRNPEGQDVPVQSHPDTSTSALQLEPGNISGDLRPIHSQPVEKEISRQYLEEQSEQNSEHPNNIMGPSGPGVLDGYSNRNPVSLRFPGTGQQNWNVQANPGTIDLCSSGSWKQNEEVRVECAANTKGLSCPRAHPAIAAFQAREPDAITGSSLLEENKVHDKVDQRLPGADPSCFVPRVVAEIESRLGGSTSDARPSINCLRAGPDTSTGSLSPNEQEGTVRSPSDPGRLVSAPHAVVESRPRDSSPHSTTG